MDTVNTVTCNKQNLMPKLRRNRRIETKWGVKYHTAVKNAVFITQASPYVPIEPPPSLKEYVSECDTVYMCVQCKDCFHFRSSLEDHIARKSWILGYWCQQCFMTTCGHSSREGLLCSACVQLDRNKRSYLRSRGLHKSQKFGAIKVFYNQCQFFAHLKIHNLNLVDMGDLMLMPLPTNINYDWNPEIDVVLEALMQHTFIMKVHIMDWLKDKNIDNNWWQLASNESENNNNPVTRVLKGYKGRLYFKPVEIPIEEQFSILNSSHSVSNNSSVCSDIEIIDSVENVDKSKSSSSIDVTTFNSDKTVIENEDNPCTPNDIAFVDCGPASKYFEPEAPLSSYTRKHTTDFAKSVQDSSVTLELANMVTNRFKKNRATYSNCISSDMVMSYGNTMITPKYSTKDYAKCSTDKQSWKNITHKSNNKSTSSVKLVTESNIAKLDSDKKTSKTIPENLLSTKSLSKVQSDTSSSVIKADTCNNKLDKLKQSIHTVTVNSGQKIVTFQSTKHVDINTIINQLSPHIVNSKKIVFIGQDSDVITIHNKHDACLRKDTKTPQTKSVVPFHTSSELPNKNFAKTIPKSQLQTVSMKNKSRSFSGKVIYQNGRKYIIKQSSGFTKHSRNVSKAIMTTKGGGQSKGGTVQSKSVNNIPPLIPINSTELENISNQERMNSLHGDVSPLTPSPSPSELSSSSSCDVQSKQSSSMMKGTQKIKASHLNSDRMDASIDMQSQNSTFESLSFHKGEDENLYLDVKYLNQKLAYTIVDTSTMITKCKQEMLNEFFHLPYAELRKRYEHLQQISDEVSRTMNFVTDNIVKENLKAVNILQHVLKHCIDKCSEKIDDISEKDTPLNEWESEYEQVDEKSVCRTCNKITKPKSYIPGFSKPAKNDNYCACYRHVCHKCHTYQGNSMRFVAHQIFHDKEKPYLCPDCYRKFTSFKSLEIHTWTTCFHTLKTRILGCKICELDGFQDMESVARHFAIMHSHNKIACDKCRVVLPSYFAYKEHHKEKHPDADELRPIRLVLCKLGQCIVRCEEYMLHMEKHLVVQRLIWFKCPFCTFTNVEAKQIMSHLQSEHLPRMKELVSSEVLWNILPMEVAASLLNASPSQNKFPSGHAESGNDGTIMPKIINTRTITSEVFEHGAQIADDCLTNYNTPRCPKVAANVNSEPSSKQSKMFPKILDVRSIVEQTSDDSKPVKIEMDAETSKETVNIKCEDDSDSVWYEKTIKPDPDGLNDEPLQSDRLPEIKEEKNLSDNLQNKPSLKEQQSKMQTQDKIKNEASISKPPPLARIPKYIIESNQPQEVEQTAKEVKTTTPLRTYKIVHRRPQRIALNGPNNSKEVFNFSCHLCGELIDTSPTVVSDHFHSKHSQDCKLSVVTSRLLRISPEFINDGYKDLLGSRKRKSDNVTSNSKRRRRWTPKKHTDSKNANFVGLGLCVKQETAEDSEGNFRCKKCNQRCTDMANLREHIASNHRIRGRYLVCLECGDNFVVAPSLQMHLKAFHGIEDPITYMAQNTSYAPDSVDDLEAEGKLIEANQCHVCMAVFEDKAAVDKHLRVHGMAFLNRKRIEAQNALKSPEKKNETEEEKRTPLKTYSKGPVRKDKPAETILEKITATI